MPRVTLDAAEAAELAETLQRLSDWIAGDPARLGPSLEDFIGHPGYGSVEPCPDLDLFIFLLGGNDGEPVFGP